MTYLNVSIIVPAYNCAHTIGPCIESLLCQDYPDNRREIIVVDNNSSDETADIIKRYPVQLAYETNLQSPGAARNRGIDLAKHEILAFIDADCVAEPNWLSNLVQPFSQPDVGIVGGQIASQEPGPSLVEKFLFKVKSSSASRFNTSEPKGFPTGNVAYRRDALQQAGPFDSAMPWGEDIDLAWRVQVFGKYTGVYIDDAIVYHKHHSSLKGLFQQYKKYGYVEILLSTLYRGQTFHFRSSDYQIKQMIKQIYSLMIYPLSFFFRLFRSRRSERIYLFEPLLWFVLDSGYLWGKVVGLVKTVGFRHNPHSSKHINIKRQE